MGIRNFLIDGGSGTGKTAVCEELARRGYHAIHGDRELAYQGDPVTGVPVAGVTGTAAHDHHLWNTERVRALAADRRADVTFFCGGSRNTASFLDVFDGVFVLTVDAATLTHRLDQRPDTEWGGRGRPAERKLIMQLHANQEDLPGEYALIDAAAPLNIVVDQILALSNP
ncbi:nucleoside kinase (plasmid) [Arthrobacter agilis]|uniref:nucleoside kinase n=1 Tax=Arthrobacter agilis TaxID=37921 RepID=UPI0023655311|nr:nucleoside kinase [Arthrobacter agilis]WDF35247.1 nucleoside kinase [Arthrobacter agilis]